MRKPTKHPETPARAYGQAREDIRNLSKLLDRVLDERLTLDCLRADWSDAATAQAVRAQLAGIVASFLVEPNGSEAVAHARIEAELDALRD